MGAKYILDRIGERGLPHCAQDKKITEERGHNGNSYRKKNDARPRHQERSPERSSRAWRFTERK